MPKIFQWVKLPGVAILTHAASSMRCPAGTHFGCSFVWLSLCVETVGMAVAQSWGRLD